MEASDPRGLRVLQHVQWPPGTSAPDDLPSIPPPERKALPMYIAEGELTPREWGVQLREVADRHLAPGQEGKARVLTLRHAMAYTYPQWAKCYLCHSLATWESMDASRRRRDCRLSVTPTASTACWEPLGRLC